MSTNFDNSPATADAFSRPTAGDPLNAPDQVTVVNGHSDAIENIEKRLLGTFGGGFYTPTSYGNGLSTFTGTWVGFYWDLGNLGYLSMSLAVTANWAGSGYIEVDLPSGWTAANLESTLTGYGYSMPTLGAHFECTGIVHANATRMRFIANKPKQVAGSGVTSSPVDVASHQSLAIDGVNTPFAFTGDATVGNQDRMFVAGWIVKL